MFEINIELVYYLDKRCATGPREQDGGVVSVIVGNATMLNRSLDRVPRNDTLDRCSSVRPVLAPNPGVLFQYAPGS